MIFSLFKRREDPVIERLYGEIVSQARKPAFYRDLHVPDTVEGRFDMILLHLILLFKRVEAEGPEALAIAQKVLDRFFVDMDHSIREMGVGDVTVPKKMKKLGEAYAGRAAAYGPALTAGDTTALAAALVRNVYADATPADGGQALAAYARAAHASLAGVRVSTILGDRIPWPDPAT